VRAAAAVDETLAALGDPTRRPAIHLLRVRPRRPGELAAALDVSPPVVSRHLRVLRTRRLVEEERSALRDSRLRLYRLRPHPSCDLRGWLEQVEAFWTAQLDSFKSHSERPRKGRRT
jgi:DNA-binding transcriptional ArsR family regulator